MDHHEPSDTVRLAAIEHFILDHGAVIGPANSRGQPDPDGTYIRIES